MEESREEHRGEGMEIWGGGEITHQSIRVLSKQVRDTNFSPQYTQQKRVLDKRGISYPKVSSFYICNNIFEPVY